MKLNANLTRSTGVAALGGLLFGFDTAVIAGTTHGLTEAFHLTPSSLGLTVSIALWGTILGAMTAGIPGDRLGKFDRSVALCLSKELDYALNCDQPAVANDLHSVADPLHLIELVRREEDGEAALAFFQYKREELLLH